MSAHTDTLQADRERKARLYFEHPDECLKFVGTLPYLIHPPSKLSATASWIRFRDKTPLPVIGLMPDDPNLPNFLTQAERILAWRETAPAQDRFWKE